jgi:hypothetical protein
MMDMNLDRSLSAKVDFLITEGALGYAHSAADLFAHLCGTRNLLVLWGAHPALCDAGLFHSVYGTEAFRESLVAIDKRDRVREVIGPDAEEIVYLFGAMSKATLYANLDRRDGFTVNDRFSGKWVGIDESRLRDLCNLTAANWLEQRPRFPREMQQVERDEFQKMLPLLLPKAQTTIRTAYSFT